MILKAHLMELAKSGTSHPDSRIFLYSLNVEDGTFLLKTFFSLSQEGTAITLFNRSSGNNASLHCTHINVGVRDRVVNL